MRPGSNPPKQPKRKGNFPKPKPFIQLPVYPDLADSQDWDTNRNGKVDICEINQPPLGVIALVGRQLQTDPTTTAKLSYTKRSKPSSDREASEIVHLSASSAKWPWNVVLFYALAVGWNQLQDTVNDGPTDLNIYSALRTFKGRSGGKRERFVWLLTKVALIRFETL